MTGVSRQRFRRSLKWAFLMTWSMRLMTTVLTVVLAALLGPREFGVVAIATIVIAFLTLLVEQGFVTAIVQRENLEPGHLDAAFWMNMGSSALLMVICIALSGWWADLNNVPEVEPMVMVLSVVLILRGLTRVQVGVLQRAMDFKSLGIRTNLATLTGGVIGIGLAVAGAGAWALVAQTLVYEAVSVVALYTVSDWRPRFRFSLDAARDLFGYSISVFFANFAGFFYRQSDALLLGVFCSPQVVGIYRLCDRLVATVLEVTMRPINVASLPYFSRLQNAPDELRGAVAWTIRLALSIAIPVLLIVAASSPWVLGAVGEEWVLGATALKLLCVVGIAKSMINFVGPLLFAVDRPRIRAWTMWGLAAISTGTVVAAGLSVENSDDTSQLLTMSLSRALVFVAIVIPINLLVVHRVTGFSPRTMLAWLPAPLVSGGVALGAGQLLETTGALDGVSRFAALVVAGAVTTVACAVTFLSLDARARQELSRLLRRRRWSGRGRRPAAAEPDS